MKKIIVTGGSGFIGSNLIKKALKKGYNIVNLDNITYASSSQNNKDLISNPYYKFIKVDIRDSTKIEKIINFEQPNFIMNLAAETHVDNSIISPQSFIQQILWVLLTFLKHQEIFNKNKGKSFIFHHISTDEVFGSLGKMEVSMRSPYSPRSPYSASKASSDHLVKAWQVTYNLPTLITNCSNNFGPYQHPEKLIPLVITNILRNKKIPVYGDGKNVRDWLYVDDHADALLKVLERGKIGENYNIGSEMKLKLRFNQSNM